MRLRLPILKRRSDAIAGSASRRRRSAIRLFGLCALLAGCAQRPYIPLTPTRPPAEVRAEIVRLIPARVADRDGWARDIEAAFAAQDIAPTTSHLCSVLAVTAQESSFQADPPVPGLGRIARKEMERRAAAAHVPHFVLDAALRLTSPDGYSYGERLKNARTEKQLSAIYQDFIGVVPLGRRLFGGFNPVHTGGPMQVSVDFAKAHAQDYPYPVPQSIRHEVFTRRGGMYFGIAHLLGYSPPYSTPLYRFADFNAGRYASRNAAFQHAVSLVTGIPLALDGDLVVPHTINPGQTERATRTLEKQLDLSDGEIRSALLEGDSADFEDSDLYKRLFALADKSKGKSVARAVLPGIKLESPKITRNLTTAWFAKRVEDRWQQCMRRAAGG